MRVLLIVPAYNEEESILSVVETVRAAGYDYVVVNDGSTDGTRDLCLSHGVNFVDLSQNLGIGGAVQTGHRYALENNYDVDIQFERDGHHDVAYIPRLLEGIESGADLVIGSRFVGGTGGFKSTAARRAGIRWLERWIRLFTGRTVTDATSGFRASGRRAIRLFSENYPSDYPEPESIVLADRSGLLISEVPVMMHERQGGTSSIGALSGVYYIIKVSLAIALAARSGRAS